jgi:hypothetical protein
MMPIRNATAARTPKLGDAAGLNFIVEDRLALLAAGRLVAIDRALVLTVKTWRHASHPARELPTPNCGSLDSIIQCGSDSLLVP